MEIRVGRVLGNRFHEKRTALSAIQQKPAPKIGTFARSPNRLPSATDERKVQDNDRVRCAKPDFGSVIGPEVAIHDPALFLNQPPLYLRPLLTRFCDKARPPENLVELYHRKLRNLAQADSESRLASSSTT